MNLDELRIDNAKKQRRGLPFICASVIIWVLILIVISLKMPIQRQNMLVLCCSCVLMPLAKLAYFLSQIKLHKSTSKFYFTGVIIG